MKNENRSSVVMFTVFAVLFVLLAILKGIGPACAAIPGLVLITLPLVLQKAKLWIRGLSAAAGIVYLSMVSSNGLDTEVLIGVIAALIILVFAELISKTNQ